MNVITLYIGIYGWVVKYEYHYSSYRHGECCNKKLLTYGWSVVVRNECYYWHFIYVTIINYMDGECCNKKLLSYGWRVL